MISNHTEFRDKILNIFNYLHTHPELSWKEEGTTKYIKQMLEANGCHVRTFAGCTGVVGDIGQGKPVVAVRADMDALWQEVDGEFRENHSCGHDAHMAIVLGVLFAIKQMDTLHKGTIRFIFQPAEEKGTGALKMVEEKVVDDVDFLYGVHLRPIQEMAKGQAAPAINHGAARFIKGTIRGEDSHGARPHLSTNAIQVGADFVHHLQGIHLDPLLPYSIKMTSFHAGGESTNIIPGNANFSLDLRAQTNKGMEQLASQTENIARALEALYKVKINLETGANIAAAEVNGEAQSVMEEAISSVLGAENVTAPLVTSGGDDFHFYTIKRPHLKATMLGLGCNLQPGLHHPNMTFDREAMFIGINILTKAILSTLEKGDSNKDD
ncbi:M20 peptidase aminoacylase family protein [Bacillus sp. T33-2]|uniref:M20 peptidase aminoacylase family protein n=1 Tax=Bacillus sp. T33-2 TaxID=2054168 RepID=UPI000C75C69D|nr:M20 peptidase aminoacylase family protein [Bacillus sp. T33-2]PLR95763.1 amidohydrolase [Bacillus sp. T33-2]